MRPASRLVMGIVGGLLLAPHLAWANLQLGEQPGYVRERGFDLAFAYVASGNGIGQIEYLGMAEPGTATSASTWSIRKYTYDSSNRVSEVHWADGTNKFTKSFDLRATYDYTP